MSTNQFIIHGRTIKEKDKTKCGDFLQYQHIKDENIIVLSLADGVGSNHYDFVASETACNQFLDSFKNNNSVNLNDRFKNALKDADKLVSNPYDSDHRGMMSTLIGVVWNIKSNSIIYDSIGDSRLYKYSAKGLQQISNDAKKAVLMRDSGGKLLKHVGVLVIREGLTKALGYNGAVISVKNMDFNGGESLILCSDGAYNIDGFVSSISNLLSTNISEKILDKFIAQNNEYFDDDASILI